MSTLKADTIQSTGGGAATLTKQSAAKSFATCVSNASPVTIDGSLNISSVTDAGTGNFSPQFSSAMSNDDYSIVATGANNGSTSQTISVGNSDYNESTSTTSFRLSCTDDGNAQDDGRRLCFNTHGDLA